LKTDIGKVEELCALVERALDAAVTEQKFLMKLYPILKTQKFTRRECTQFIESTTAANLSSTCMDLEDYIKGGSPVLREAYGHIPKPVARKVLKFLTGILEDAWQYEKDRRPGRKKATK